MNARYKKILVPVDGGRTSKLGLNEAIELAKHHKARLRLIYVVDVFIITPTLEGGRNFDDIEKSVRAHGSSLLKTAEALVGKYHLVVDSAMFEIVGGRAADIIVAQAKKWGADLIVIGTHGRRGIKRLVMGSDAEQVVRTSPVPVLLVRATHSRRRS